MKRNRLSVSGTLIAVGLAVGLLAASQAWTTQTSNNATKSTSVKALDDALKTYKNQLRVEEKARQKDPLWRPSFEEVGVIEVGKANMVNAYCLNTDGNLLVSYGGDRVEYVVDEKSGSVAIDPATKRLKMNVTKLDAQILVYSPDGTKVESWPLTAKATAICVHKSGAIYVGSEGRVTELDQSGAVVRSSSLPALAGAEVSSIAVTDKDLFVVFRSPKDYSFGVYRLTRELKDAKKIVSGLSGCCGVMDVQAYNGDVWVAHNGSHRVERYDRNGVKLFSFGKEDRKAADGFGGCCEPKCLRFGENGVLYASESGPPTVIKSFTTKGKFLGVVALPKMDTGCVNVTVEVNKDASRFYILDSEGGKIHVMAKK